MEQLKKVAVIGGTGKSGKYLVTQLINQGYHFKALVRNPERFQIHHPLVEVVIGDVRNYEVIRTLIDGCDAVISTLGLGLPPSEPTIFSLATQHILRAMTEANVQRYVLATGLNVDTPFDKKGAKTKFATDWMYTNYPISTADRQTEYCILKEGLIDWTLVRLPLIEQTDVSTQVRISLEDCPADKISATDLAHFFIQQLADTQYHKQAPFIASI